MNQGLAEVGAVVEYDQELVEGGGVKVGGEEGCAIISNRHTETGLASRAWISVEIYHSSLPQ